MIGYLRQDGRKGIRNVVLVVYLVECAHHVARKIVSSIDSEDVQLVGFPGCFPNEYSLRVMKQVCTHPNVGGVVLISLGCEGFDREALANAIQASNRPVQTLVIQETGGTVSSINVGVTHVKLFRKQLSAVETVEMKASDLVVGTICGGSDGTSPISANPAVGHSFDRLVGAEAACIFEETGELIGCEALMAARSSTPNLAREIEASVKKAARYYELLGYGSFAPGNAEGGLTTIEEKSLGAYAKSGSSEIRGLIKPGDVPPGSGLYLLDVVPDGEPRFGFPNISDNAEIVELIACGAHVILFTTGRGSVVGSAVSPVIKICGNPDTCNNLKEDMDINAGRIIEGNATTAEIGDEIYSKVIAVANGERTKSELLRHQEFILTYKAFDPIGPACLPSRVA